MKFLLILLLTIFAKEIYADTLEIKASTIRPGSLEQREFLKAFNLYNEELVEEKAEELKSYEEKILKSARSRLINSRQAKIWKEMPNQNKNESLYRVTLITKVNGRRNYSDDEQAFLRFQRKVELATDAEIYLFFEDTTKLLDDGFGRKYKLYNVSEFGTFDDLLASAVAAEKKMTPPLTQGQN